MTGLKGFYRPGQLFVSAWLLVCAVSVLPASGQTGLQRISTVERSDGQGYVIRYHLSQRADSFAVIQPETHLIQMKIYAEEMDTTGIRIDEPVADIRGIHLYRLAEGYGVNIELSGENYYSVRAYPDQNEHDLLLALGKTGMEEITRMTEETDPFVWNTAGTQELAGNPGETAPNLFDDGFTQIQENLNFDTIVIDAGHGGKDPGSIGHGGLREKDVTLSVALKVGSYINEYLPDVNVIYTRDDDNFVELEERGKVANRGRGDFFVSIHANAFRRQEARGSEIYFLGLARSQTALDVMKRENSVVHLESGNGIGELTEEDLLIYELANAGNLTISERIAEKMEYQFRERAQRPTRGVKQAQFVVLYHASMPALMVELGFITNPGEARYLSSEYGQSIVASAIFRAIRDYKDEYERSRNISRSD